MQKITIEVTNDEARSIAYFLRKLYGKDKRTSLSKLCRISVRMEVSRQAKTDLDEAEAQLNSE